MRRPRGCFLGAVPAVTSPFGRCSRGEAARFRKHGGHPRPGRARRPLRGLFSRPDGTFAEEPAMGRAERLSIEVLRDSATVSNLRSLNRSLFFKSHTSPLTLCISSNVWGDKKSVVGARGPCQAVRVFLNPDVAPLSQEKTCAQIPMK